MWCELWISIHTRDIDHSFFSTEIMQRKKNYESQDRILLEPVWVMNGLQNLKKVKLTWTCCCLKLKTFGWTTQIKSNHADSTDSLCSLSLSHHPSIVHSWQVLQTALSVYTNLMNIFVGQPTLVYEEVRRKILLMNLSLSLQQCLACLVQIT